MPADQLLFELTQVPESRIHHGSEPEDWFLCLGQFEEGSVIS